MSTLEQAETPSSPTDVGPASETQAFTWKSLSLYDSELSSKTICWNLDPDFTDPLHGVELQKFDYTKGSKEEYPEFECSIPKGGCHSVNDCYYMVGVWCNCGGRTCVRHKSEKQILGLKCSLQIFTCMDKYGSHVITSVQCGSRF
ncbi:hypothetical protein pdam_00016265 [Pocillopora damicornis]|uniref:Uncharacterized protein n=1 Tax=Pocillopora damicornis TaxID=46731 RepID=A0A3M6TAR4_POCDA|nr:hypothetical protein pdam_00016265 [Pocillopora damicornis]